MQGAWSYHAIKRNGRGKTPRLFGLEFEKLTMYCDLDRSFINCNYDIQYSWIFLKCQHTVFEGDSIMRDRCIGIVDVEVNVRTLSVCGRSVRETSSNRSNTINTLLCRLSGLVVSRISAWRLCKPCRRCERNIVVNNSSLGHDRYNI